MYGLIVRRLLVLLLMAAFALVATGIGDDADAARKKRKRRSSQQIEQTVKSEPAEQEAKVDDLLAAAPGASVLEAGKLRAVVRSLTEGRPVLAGGSAFAEVTVRKPKGSRIDTAELRITATGGTPAVIASDLSVKSKRDGETLVAMIDLRKSASQSLLVELKGAAQSGSAGPELRIVLATPSAETPSVSSPAALAFSMTDCAARFHGELSRIFTERTDLFADGLKRASSVDERLPGSWVFNPRSSIASVKSTKKKKKSEEIASLQPGVATAAERKLIDLAGVYVRSRGAAYEYARRGRYSWISNRVMTDIRDYLQQGAYPALCAGVDVMADYIESNTDYLKEAIDAASALSGEAWKASEQHVSRLRELAGPAGASPGEAPASSQLSLVSAADAATPGQPIGDGEANERAMRLIGEVAKVLFTVFEARSVTGSGDAIAALKKMAELLKAGAADARTADVRAEARLTLALIESAHYIAVGGARHGLVGNAIYGSLDAIRDARTRTCSCAP